MTKEKKNMSNPIVLMIIYVVVLAFVITVLIFLIKRFNQIPKNEEIAFEYMEKNYMESDRHLHELKVPARKEYKEIDKVNDILMIYFQAYYDSDEDLMRSLFINEESYLNMKEIMDRHFPIAASYYVQAVSSSESGLSAVVELKPKQIGEEAVVGESHISVNISIDDDGKILID